MDRIAAIISTPASANDVVRLDYDRRNRRRMVFTTEAGRSILLDMPRAVHLRDGDGLRLESGEIVRVEAAYEPLIEITAQDLPAVVRIAWHLGNRHLPTQLLGDRLRIRHDHVIADMVAGLGGHCAAIMAAFDPEGGAYASEVPTMGHGHHHAAADFGHDHQHSDHGHDDHAHHHPGHAHAHD